MYYHLLYCSWDMVCDGCNCYFSFWAIFCRFYDPNSLKNENFQNTEKKKPGDIIILHKCTKNYDMLSCSWDIWCVTDVIIFHFGLFFALFTPSPLTAWEKKMSKKQTKKTPRDNLLHMCTINQDHMMYGSWNVKCKGQSFLLFWAKKKKISFYTCVPQMTIIWCMVPKISSVTDRRTFFVILGYFLSFQKSLHIFPRNNFFPM